MNIQYAMLGLLSYKSMTGYDIKKVMQNSPLTYWSGNNSQIYRTLAELQADKFVTAEVLHNDASPTKKRYTITELGRQELRDLTRTFPELPEPRRPILLQLVFGRDFSREELETILNQYENELRGLLMTLDGRALPEATTEFESAIRDLAIQNIREFYQNEIAWVGEVRRKALPLTESREKHKENGESKMEYTSVNQNGQIYVTVTSGQIRAEQDGLDLVSACAEHGTNLLLLPAACLSDDFLRLSTRVAGLVLQKLGNYNIKAAAVFDASNTSERFREFMSESNQGQAFRVYANIKDAQAWLTGGNT